MKRTGYSIFTSGYSGSVGGEPPKTIKNFPFSAVSRPHPEIRKIKFTEAMQEAWDDWNKDVDESRRISLPTVTFREAFIRGFNRGIKEKNKGDLK